MVVCSIVILVDPSIDKFIALCILNLLLLVALGSIVDDVSFGGVSVVNNPWVFFGSQVTAIEYSSNYIRRYLLDLVESRLGFI